MSPPPGECLQVSVSSFGTELGIQLFGAQGEELIRIDSPDTVLGEMRVEIPSSAGNNTYRLEVTVHRTEILRSRKPPRFELRTRTHPLSDLDLRRWDVQRVLQQSAEATILKEQIDLAKAALQGARELADRASAQREPGDIFLQGYALLRIGDLSSKAADPEAARRAWEEAHALWLQEGDHAFAAHCLQSLEKWHHFAGDMHEALRLAELSADVWRSERIPSETAFAVFGVAIRARNLGRSAYAIRHFEEALELAREAMEPGLEISVLSYLAEMRLELGETEAALRNYRGIGAVDVSQATPSVRIARWYGIGRLHHLEKKPDQAREAYSRALLLGEETGRKNYKASILRKLGELYWEQGDTEKALEQFRASADFLFTAKNYRWAVDSYRRLGEMYSELARGEEARAAFEKARTLARRIADPRGSADAGVGLARLAREEGDLRGALAFLEEALEDVESLRAGVLVDQSRASLVSTRRPDYELAVELQVALHRRAPGSGHGDAAFRAAERARARGLLELLQQESIDLGSDLEGGLFRKREVDLARRLEEVQREFLDPETSGSRREDLEIDLIRLDEEAQKLEAEIRLADPRYAELRRPSLLGVEEVSEMLGSGVVLLEYHLGEQESYLFVIRGGEQSPLRILPLPSIREISAQVDTLRERLQEPSRRLRGEMEEVARALGKVLLDPVIEDLIGARHVVIAGDGPLHKLPFEVLRIVSPVGMEDYFLRTSAVSYIPSMSVLAGLRMRRAALVTDPEASRPEIVVFADPSFPAVEREGKDPREALRGLYGTEQDLRLGPLPATRREAASIKALLEKHSSEAAFFLGPEAREDPLDQDPRIGRARRLHFATHGLISDERPRLSSLVLSSSDENDGLLQVHEIFRLRLDAELVVLSACETGLGKELRGEGILGLTRAFFHAGAASVMVSLWPVADDSTAVLMKDFYRGELSDVLDADVLDAEVLDAEVFSTAEALRRAKLSLLDAGGLYSHPYYWAPFVLNGEFR